MGDDGAAAAAAVAAMHDVLSATAAEDAIVAGHASWYAAFYAAICAVAGRKLAVPDAFNTFFPRVT